MNCHENVEFLKLLLSQGAARYMYAKPSIDFDDIMSFYFLLKAVNDNKCLWCFRCNLMFDYT